MIGVETALQKTPMARANEIVYLVQLNSCSMGITKTPNEDLTPPLINVAKKQAASTNQP